jgi:hypothetical protein
LQPRRPAAGWQRLLFRLLDRLFLDRAPRLRAPSRLSFVVIVVVVVFGSNPARAEANGAPAPSDDLRG